MQQQQQQRQLDRQAAKFVTRLRDSIKHGTAASQQAALQALQQFADNAPAASMCILQQPLVTAALRQLLDMHGTPLPQKTAKLLGLLAQDSQHAAEQIAAQPGMLAGLARMLQPSTAQGFDLAGNCAYLAIHRLTSYCTVCQRAAADPELLAALVSVLQAAGSSKAAAEVVSGVLEVLLSLAQSGPAAALQIVQQPGAVAALANVLSSQQSYVMQAKVLVLVNAVLNSQDADNAAGTAQIVQRLQQPPQLMEHMLLIATKKRVSSAEEVSRLLGVALHLVQQILLLDPEASRQITALPAAFTALDKCLDNKEPEVRGMAGQLLSNLKLLQGVCQVLACLWLLLSACLDTSGVKFAGAPRGCSSNCSTCSCT
jgi:hypothetical protein